jgi:lysine-N-methylase
VQFRLLTAQYVRKDTAADVQAGWRRRWELFRAVTRFSRGTGLVPPLQKSFVPVPFADLEQPFGPLPPEADEILSRYFRVKLEGMHFCGLAYYNVPVVEGFQSLALVLPAVLWTARWLARGAGRTALETDDVATALAVVDHHHGYSPALGQRNARRRVRMLAQLDDIAKLVGWYTR